jgi:3-oxoacyl-[acyl-carrier protein] reductase
VTRAAEVEALVGSLLEAHGRLDVLVNLAGVIRNELLVKVKDESFALVMATHVHGTLNTMRAALPPMRERQYGRIVNMSSVAARGSIAGGAYAAAKGAIEGLTRSAAMESARAGVTINCVAPGLISAGMFLTVPEDYQRERAARIPVGRAGTAEEVASCVAFLASAEASYVTGQTLPICGGLSLGF